MFVSDKLLFNFYWNLIKQYIFCNYLYIEFIIIFIELINKCFIFIVMNECKMIEKFFEIVEN